MSVIAGTKSVNEGVILYLDPANPRCFQDGQTECNNMITNQPVVGANGTPNAGEHIAEPLNFPAYNPLYGGIFDFAGGRGMNCQEDLGAHSQFSLVLWFYKTNGGATDYLTDARNNGGQWFLSNYSSYNITYTNALTYNFGGTYNASNPDFIQKWFCMVVTSDETGSNLYLNNELITTGPSLNENLGKNFRIGARYTNTGKWTGYMGPVIAYNRVINETEIDLLFQAHRSRFNI